MTDDPEVLAAIDAVEPPKADSHSRWHAVAVVGCVIAVTALVLAAIVGLSGLSTAACVNSNLGARSAPNNRDHAAEEQWIAQVSLALNGGLTAPQIRSATQKLLDTWEADDTEKAANPIGKC